MTLALFAGILVRDYAAALPWYETLLGSPPSFQATPTEAVWELADHRWIFIEQRDDAVAPSILTVLVDDLDGLVVDVSSRGIEPHKRENYSNGARKVIYRDPEGNEIGYGEAYD